jgi:catechol 2,3-dioxygenase
MVVISGSAAFLSAGGYHHHLGINTWNGVGVPPPPPDAVGLRYFTLQLPSEEEQTGLVGRLEKAGVPFETREDGFLVRDPSQNALVFSVE